MRRIMRPILLAALLLAGCATAPTVPAGSPAAMGAAPPGPARTVADFARVASRVGRVAEQVCREENPGETMGCDFLLVFDSDPRMPPNAFQTVSRGGRPLVVFGAALLGQMSSDDEIAFVLGHEASHQIAGHIGKERAQSMLGAMIFGRIAAQSPGPDGAAPSDAAIRRAMDLGAWYGSQVYSKRYEFEADRLGAYIAARAGYDPVAGAQIFTSPVLAGGGALGSTHPASADRIAAVAAVSVEIARQEALGLVPRPENAGAGT